MNREQAIELDKKDVLAPYRSEFYFPKTRTGKDYLYFCGNSLGLQAKPTEKIVNEELSKWKNHGVEGHFYEKRPWLSYHKQFEHSIGRLVGAKAEETVTMNGLTVNLNLLLLSFYNPTKKKFKILVEKNAFPSDHYAVSSQVDLLLKKGGLSQEQAKHAIEYLEPDEWGVYETKNIIKKIEEEEVALLLLSGVNYQTGESFELGEISTACKAHKVVCGLDLAHAIGNVPLMLHDWGVDFAVWCTYKYLNGGPGSVGGAFVHEKHVRNKELPRLHGWWSNKEENRFLMKGEIDAYETAEAWQMSNAPVLSMASLLGSLEVFDALDLNKYYKKGRALSTYLNELLCAKIPEVKVITPQDRKGCQLSVFIEGKDKGFVDLLLKEGVIADWRNHKKGGILRVAPVPLYNSFEDCWGLVSILQKLVHG